MTLDVPLSVKLEEWRRRAAAGDLTTAEMREVIQLVRQGRSSAQQTSTASRARKAPVDTAALEDELDKL